MAIYVHITDRCKRDSQQHGQLQFVINLQTQIKETQHLTGFTDFLPTQFTKKGLGRSFRLIAYRFPIDQDEIIVFLRVMPRGSNDYSYFLANWQNNTNDTERTLDTPNKQILLSLYEDYTKKQPLPQLQEPSFEEQNWLYSVFNSDKKNEDELLVLETEAWVTKMKSNKMLQYLALYHQLLEDINFDELKQSDSNLQIESYWSKNRRVGFLYIYKPEIKRFLLLEPLLATDDELKFIDYYKPLLVKAINTTHTISRLAARSYPFLWF